MSLPKQQVHWMHLLGKQKPDKQCETIKNCNLTFIKDLHKLIKRVAHDKKLKISAKYKNFFQKHRIFLHNFIVEKDLKKKKKNLLRKVKGGFLGVLIPALVSIASAIIPSLLEK